MATEAGQVDIKEFFQALPIALTLLPSMRPSNAPGPVIHGDAIRNRRDFTSAAARSELCPQR